MRYKCPSCPHEARNPAELRQHVLGKHEGVTHACNLCSFTTTHPSSLKRHRLNQHAELRFACDAHSNSSNGGSLGAVTAGFLDRLLVLALQMKLITTMVLMLVRLLTRAQKWTLARIATRAQTRTRNLMLMWVLSGRWQ